MSSQAWSQSMPNDGVGIANITPPSVPCGAVATTTLIYTVTGATLTWGGSIAVHYPNDWFPSPQNYDLNALGAFSLWTSTFTGVTVLDPVELNPADLGFNWARLKITNNGTSKLVPGEKVFFSFNTIPKNYSEISQQVVEVRSQGSASGSLTPLKSGQPTINFNPGPPSWIDHESFDNIVVSSGEASSPIKLVLKDACDKPTPAGTNILVGLTLQDFFGFPDTNTQFSSATVFTSPYLISETTIPVSNAFSPPSYFMTTSTGFFNVIGSYNEGWGGGQTPRYATVVSPAQLNFSNVSVDTGTIGTATTATLTPDGSGDGDSGYINFIPSDSTLAWKVTISKDNFATLVFESIQSLGGSPGRTLNWDGRDFNNQVVPNAIYTVKIEYLNSSIQDTSLSFTVQSSSISGNISLNGTPIPGVTISVSGAPYAWGNYAISDDAGNYTFWGLQSGAGYNVSASTWLPSGQFISEKINNILAPQSGVDISMTTLAILRVHAALSKPAPYDFSGNVEVKDANSFPKGYGTLHFTVGRSTSDNGAYPFDVFYSSWTTIEVPPGNYSVDVDLFNIGLSSTAGNITLTTSSVTELVFNFTSSKSDVYGYVFLPSTQTYGTLVSVDARKQGDSFPSLFGEAWIPGEFNFEGPKSSGIFSLRGVDAGTWTLTTRTYGFASQSTNVVVDGANDFGNPVTGGADFSPFGEGGVIVGTITVLGDTSQLGGSNCEGCPPSGITLYINAYNPDTFTNGFTQVTLSTDTISSTGTFRIGGLDSNGTYHLFAHLDGFQMNTQGGPPTATVTNGTGSVNLTLAEFSGQLQGTFLLPSGRTDFNQVSLEVFGPEVEFSTNDITAISLFVSDGSSATVTSPKIGTGFYTLKAMHRLVGTTDIKTVPVVHGKTTSLILNLRSSTFTVSGTVSLNGTLSINTTSYQVSVSSVSGLVSYAAQDTFFSSGAFYGLNSTTTARIELINLDMQRFGPEGSENTGGGAGDMPVFGLGELYFAPIQPDGTYTIANVPPGHYLLRNHPDLNGNSTDGFEMAPLEKVVNVINANVVGQNFVFGNGVSVSGNVNLPAGINESRPIAIQMLNFREEVIQSLFLSFNNSNSVSYIFRKVPDGDYTLMVRDQGFPVKYVARPKTIRVTGADLTRQDLAMEVGGVIKARIAVEQVASDGTRTYVVVGNRNR
ncbi:MAG: carboxypeptidase regulatory-like domain-containing protein, partial [Elusimicrobia bacterium]|nr:carboxypeptidase regulatory-like domain-containing protein [Elusimicrobiota bacterium]